MLGQRPKHEIASIIRVRSLLLLLRITYFANFLNNLSVRKEEEWESKSTSIVLCLLGNKARKQ